MGRAWHRTRKKAGRDAETSKCADLEAELLAAAAGECLDVGTPRTMPRLLGRCPARKIRTLSVASTECPPSPDRHLYLSPPSREPMRCPAQIESALRAVLKIDGRQFKPEERRFGTLPEHYEIHNEGKYHPLDQPVLRVRGTFVEYWEPPLRSHDARRSQSVPPLPLTGADTSVVTRSMPAYDGPTEWLQHAVPRDSPPYFQGSQSSPAPETDPPFCEEPVYWSSSWASWQPNDCPYWPQHEGIAPDFYMLSLQSQMEVSGPAAGWTYEDSLAQFAGQDHIQEKGACPGSFAPCPAWSDEQDDAAILMGQEAALEEMDFTEHSKALTLPGQSDPHHVGHKGDASRKAPISDEQWARDIICAARLSSTQMQNQPGPSVWDLSRQDKHSSASVQNALEIAAYRGYNGNSKNAWSDAWAMVMGLVGHVRQAYESPFANFVLSKIFEVMPTFIVSCIAKELQGSAVEASKHRFGCRCIVRLIRYHAHSGADDESVSQVIAELLGAAGPLSRHQFGTHVMQELLDSELPKLTAAVSQTLKGNLHRDSKNRFAGRVVEKAMQKCDASDVRTMMHEVLCREDVVHQLANNEFGARVMKVILGSEYAQRTAAILCSLSVDSVSSRSGRLLLQEARGILERSGSNVAGQ